METRTRRDPRSGRFQHADERNRSRNKRAGKGEAGFTLVEIMVVVVIIGMLATMVSVAVIGQLKKAQREKARGDIANFVNALDLYYVDNSRYPTTDQGLQALVEKPSNPEPKNYPRGGYLKQGEIPLDPWGYEYIYSNPGVAGGDFSIESYGADGLDGGEDENADIESWNLGQ